MQLSPDKLGQLACGDNAVSIRKRWAGDGRDCSSLKQVPWNGKWAQREGKGVDYPLLRDLMVRCGQDRVSIGRLVLADGAVGGIQLQVDQTCPGQKRPGVRVIMRHLARGTRQASGCALNILPRIRGKRSKFSFMSGTEKFVVELGFAKYQLAYCGPINIIMRLVDNSEGLVEKAKELS